MNWTEERIELLKKLWAEGHSASQIGKMLGVSKNAVVGKAHRMKLAARPSPIKRSAKSDGTKKDAPAKKAAPKAVKPTAPAAPKPAVKPAAPVAAKPVSTPVPPKPKAPVAPAARVAAPRPVTPASKPTAAEIKAASLPAKARRKASMDAADRKLFSGAMEKRKGPKCLWPHGDPGDADFHFCGAPAVPSKPYCAEHCARAYITKSSRSSSNSNNSNSSNENQKSSDGEEAKTTEAGNKQA
ncbi:GcrA family cell cycle regulator [Kiloniella spongiae]|uniref:GcrA family cell cycle regulator n=1 Tax=Kiloniella spongiae TaxID=1489064 RepID=UPI00069C642F|nr:GcrA family cell cycle regulator [Kiloniella spongiae]